MKLFYRLRLAGLALGLLSTSSGTASADVPVSVAAQVQLIGRLAAFDRKLPVRAGGTVRVMIVRNPRDEESTRNADLVNRALASLGDIAGLPKEIRSIPFVSPQALAETCRAQKIAILYLSVGLESQTAAIGIALSGTDVLSIGPTSAYAREGAVVGFELEAGKPRIIVNLSQARKQNVDFKPDFLKLSILLGDRTKRGKKEETDLGY